MKSWSVTVLSETSVLKKFSQHPSPEALYGFLTRSYPGAEYHSVYEAGFCGFWIHERLTALGIDNIVVNPADVPTKSSEKLRKTDTVDSGKLARSLRANELKGIYTPDSVSLEMRSLIRLKNSITKDTTRQKNRLKSQLWYLGIKIPQEFLTPLSNWSKRFFAWLQEVGSPTPRGPQAPSEVWSSAPRPCFLTVVCCGVKFNAHGSPLVVCRIVYAKTGSHFSHNALGIQAVTGRGDSDDYPAL